MKRLIAWSLLLAMLLCGCGGQQPEETAAAETTAVVTEPVPETNMHGSSRHGSSGSKRGKKMHVIVPKKTSLKKRIRCDDENFLDFLKKLLTVDPNLRLSAKEALKHKWLTQVKY